MIVNAEEICKVEEWLFSIYLSWTPNHKISLICDSDFLKNEIERKNNTKIYRKIYRTNLRDFVGQDWYFLISLSRKKRRQVSDIWGLH